MPSIPSSWKRFVCYTFTVVISRFLLFFFLLFFCFSDISAHAFITHVDPSEVDVEARQLAEGEPRLLDVTRDRVIPLSPPPHDHAEDGPGAHDGRGDGAGPSIAYEGGHGDQNDSHVGRNPSWRLVVSKKWKQTVKPSAVTLPPKKLRADNGLLNRPTTSYKSWAAIKSLMSSYLQGSRHFHRSSPHVPSGSFVSEREVGVHLDDSIDSLLCIVRPAERFIVSSDSSSFLGTFGIEVDSFARSSDPSTSVATKAIESSTRPLLYRKKKKADAR